MTTLTGIEHLFCAVQTALSEPHSRPIVAQVEGNTCVIRRVTEWHIPECCVTVLKKAKRWSHLEQLARTAGFAIVPRADGSVELRAPLRPLAPEM
jgi:hypothetical protein